MPAETRGSVYKTRTGYGIRWPEDGKRQFCSGFATKTEARRWFVDNVAPRLRRGAPSGEITYDAFCGVFLERHGATIAPRSRDSLEERLGASRDRFGSWTLRELEGAAADIAAWRASLGAGSRYRLIPLSGKRSARRGGGALLPAIPLPMPAATRNHARPSCTRSRLPKSTRLRSNLGRFMGRWLSSRPKRG
jgi:hypothetical protein